MSKVVLVSVQIEILAALIASTAHARGAKDVIDVGAGQVCVHIIDVP